MKLDTLNFYNDIANSVKEVYDNMILTNTSKVKDTTDVVSDLDITLNAMSRYFVSLLRKKGLDIGFYGEESCDLIAGQPEFLAVCDPVDGTRPLVEGIGFSAYSLAFFKRRISEKIYEYYSGLVVLFDNQNRKVTDYFVTIGKTVYRNGTPLLPIAFENKKLNEVVVDFTLLRQYAKDGKNPQRYQTAANLCERVRHLTNNVSGAATGLNVVLKKFDAFINSNPTTSETGDIMSHPVVIEIARKLGLSVFSMRGQEYNNNLLLDNDGCLKRPQDDYTVLICNPSITEDLFEIIGTDW